jgi:hypothetical protein
MIDNRTQVFDVAMKNARTIEACVDRLAMIGADHELKLIAGRLWRLSRLTFRTAPSEEATGDEDADTLRLRLAWSGKGQQGASYSPAASRRNAKRARPLPSSTARAWKAPKSRHGGGGRHSVADATCSRLIEVFSDVLIVALLESAHIRVGMVHQVIRDELKCIVED